VRKRGRFLVALLLSGAALASAPARAEVPAGSTKRVAVTAAQLLKFAEQLGRDGQIAQAETILAALAGDPDPMIRSEARFRHSQLLKSKGQNVAAAVLLRKVIDEQPAAVPPRLELAGLLQQMGDLDGAWRQMRSVRSTGLPANVARQIDRYSQALRASRPMGASLEMALAPDTNINRATRADSLGTVIGDFEIDEDGKAKSGVGVALRGQAYRRLNFGDDRWGLLGRISGSGDLYRKSEFNDVAIDVAAGPELRLGRAQVNAELGVTQRWFGQAPYQRSARASANLSHPLGGRALVRLKTSAMLIDNRVNDLQDGRAFAGSVSIERALGPVTGLVATLGGDRLSAEDPGYSTKAWRAGLDLWRDVGRVTLSGSAEIGRLRADERLALFPDRRSDRFTRFSLAATFRQLEWMGFAPVARLAFERNRSTIEFYDYRRTRTELGVVRAF
jgi:hypothetical protein